MTDPTNPPCSSVLGGISAYLDGELEATACDLIERHCDSCSQCAEVVQGLRDTIGLCRGAQLAELPADVRQKAQSSVRALLSADSGDAEQGSVTTD